MKGERGREHQCMIASHTTPPGDPACNPGMCPDQELNQQRFGLQPGTRSTESHQPGQECVLKGKGNQLCYSRK